jgi:hypothetical protein
VAWHINLACAQEELDGVKGTVVGFYVFPYCAPEDVMFVLKWTLKSLGTIKGSEHDTADSANGRGFSKFFSLDATSAGGGWDEAEWAAAGLPESGELQLILRVHSVGS